MKNHHFFIVFFAFLFAGILGTAIANEETDKLWHLVDELDHLNETCFKSSNFDEAIKILERTRAEIVPLEHTSLIFNFCKKLCNNVDVLVADYSENISEEQNQLEMWILEYLQKSFLKEKGGFASLKAEQKLALHNPRLVPDFPKYRRERTDAMFQYVSEYTYALRPEEYEKVLALKKEWDDYYNSDEFPKFKGGNRGGGAVRVYGYVKAEWPCYLADESQKDRYVEMLGKIRAFSKFETDQRIRGEAWPKEMPEILDYLRKFYSREPFALEELKELSQKYPQEKTFKKELKKLIAELQKAEKEAKKAKKKSSKSKTKKAKKAKEDLDE